MSDILLRADAIAGQGRSRDYGHPKANHDRIATMWNAWFHIKGFDSRVTAADVAWMMILLKIAREVNTPKDDNRIDAAGYIKCIDMILSAESQNRNGLNWEPPAQSPQNEGDLTEAGWKLEKEMLCGTPKSEVVEPWNCGSCKCTCDYTKQWNAVGVPLCDKCWNLAIPVPAVSVEQIQAAIAER